MLDDRTLAFADFAGNAQYISVGNLDENDKAFIFLMDYSNRRRVKVWGSASYVEDDQQLLADLVDDEYSGRVERAILFRVRTWDINCPQHIKMRFSERELASVVADYERRIRELEAELQRLRGITP